MSFLMHFFSSDAKLAEQLAHDEPLLHKSMERYFASHKTKQEALADLVAGKPMQQLLPAFHLALADEMLLIAGSEKTERQIIEELESFHHEQHSAEFDKIVLTMNHEASQEKYIYHLMKQLHALLVEQAHTITALQKNPESKELQQALIKELELEQRMADELGKVEDLEKFYKSLALGERRKHELEKGERDFAEAIYEQMMDYEVVEGGELQPLSENSISWLTAHCFNKLEEEVLKAVNDGILDQHPHVVYEFVNSDLFEQFVIREIHSRNLRDFNDKNTIKSFIHIFRELYNTRIEQEVA